MNERFDSGLTTIAAGRMPVARDLAQRLKVPKDADAETILRALETFERELIALAGAPDPELLETVAMVERTFPGARLVEIRKLK